MAGTRPLPMRLSDRRTRALLAQLAGAAALLLVAAVLGRTLAANLARLNLSPGFGFLWRPAGMQIGESALPFESTDSFAWAIAAGAVNTLRVAAAAVVLATVVGVVVGIMRLSANPLLRAITAVYVELFRNIPLLLQIVFWAALVLQLPDVRQAVRLGGGVYLSQRGLQLPALALGGGPLWPGLLAGAACGLASMLLLRRARAGWRGAAMAAAALAAALALWVAQGAVALDWPVRRLLGFRGGMALTPEFCSLLAGLAAYAGAFIAEIVRGGILAVPHGQWEACRSLGLRNGAIMRLVVLPQAVRVILPAVTSQYVGIVKNSSLAIVIGYPDLFWAISTAINVTGHAIEGVAVMMLAYLVLTLGTAGAMNAWYGRLLRRGMA